MLNVLIAYEDNNLVELIFKEIVRKNNKLRLSDYTYDGKSTLNSILQYHPDVIILDFEMPKMNGRAIIEHIYSIKDEYYPYIIGVSSGKKYLDNIYNAEQVYRIIDKDEGFTKILDSINIYLEQIYEEIKNREIYNKIKKELNNFNINISSKSTDYLIDSILLSYNKECLNLSKDVYPTLSKKYQVKPMNIKWSMEKNIKSIKRYTGNEIIAKYFHVDSKSNLTIKTVIKTIADNI